MPQKTNFHPFYTSKIEPENGATSFKITETSTHLYAFGLEQNQDYTISVSGKLSENVFTNSRNIDFTAENTVQDNSLEKSLDTSKPRPDSFFTLSAVSSSSASFIWSIPQQPALFYRIEIHDNDRTVATIKSHQNNGKIDNLAPSTNYQASLVIFFADGTRNDVELNSEINPIEFSTSGVITGLDHELERGLQWRAVSGAKSYTVRVFPGGESVSKKLYNEGGGKWQLSHESVSVFVARSHVR